MTTSSRPTIIGLSGMNGAGKDTVAEMLGKRHNFYVGVATDMFREELEKRGLPTDRIHKSKLSAEWRREFGMAVIVDRAYAYYIAHKSEYDGMIIGSLRHPGEADRIHELGGSMIWVDADPHIRYERIQDNAHARGLRMEDDQPFEQWQADEEREMHPEGDEATLNGAAVRDRADYKIMNDGDDIEAFKDEAEKVLGFDEN
jgi:dephospho-CoA kinase